MDVPLKILLIEDDEVDRTMVRRALKASGVPADFEEVSSGEAGLQAIQAGTFDCALLDYRLPDADGLSVLRQIREAGVTTPIIMLTGQGDEQLAVEMMKAGASDYLSKSRLSRDLLSHAVRHVVGLHRAQTQAHAAQAQQLESERKYQFLSDFIPHMVFTTDPQGSPTYFNRRWMDFTGLQPEQGRDEGWKVLVHPDDLEQCVSIWRESVAVEGTFEVEARLRRHDGVFRWHLIRAEPFRDDSGNITKWFGTCTDIEDQKRSADALHFLAEASEMLSSSLDYETTLASVAKLAVPRIADWCTIDMLDDAGQPHRLVLIHSDPEKIKVAEELQRLYPSGPDDAALKVLRTGMSELFPEINDAMIEQGARDPEHGRLLKSLGIRSALVVPLLGREGTLGTMSLVSAESGYQYGAQELALAEDLARRAGTAVDNARLYRELIEAKDTAEAANTAKDQFLAVLSHELRTPLTPVLSTVQAMESDPDLPTEFRGSLEMIRRNVELEARLIDDLLDLTRIARGKIELHLQPLDVHALLRNALEICYDELRGKRQQLLLQFEAKQHFVQADSARLQQVFWNLIKNAIKFTPEGGRITIRSSNERAGIVRVEVRDSGIGIEPQLLPQIFNAFEQGERSITRRFGGLGLGLAISKALMDMQGGDLRADSAGKDKGSVFVASMPVVAAPVITEKKAGSPGTADPQGLRILLVDDHEDTAKAMRRLLERLGYAITLAGNVQDALGAFGKNEFDLLISDIGLPDGSGLELMRQIRQQKNLRGIALSGFGMEEDVRKSKEAGFTEHLIKPINFQKLQAVIREVATKE
ncbi:MAG TPA: response regulator [Tepidisphaeraceae bacterium]|nr:response regulator [Tepidisphaeraceae bacterium]